MQGLKSQNNGRMVPLTLLPLKIGSLVAFHVQKVLEDELCTTSVAVSTAEETPLQQLIPRVTVKWPNDILLHSPSAHGSHEKIAGVLIESAQDWFLIGIGINVGYAPTIPSDGANRGRTATCLSQYCSRGAEAASSVATAGGEGADAAGDGIAAAEEAHWIKVSHKLATDIAYDLHSWLHPPSSLSHSAHSGESILEQWKSYVDWDMELTMRDTPQREQVKLKAILEDGRVVVQDVETGDRKSVV